MTAYFERAYQHIKKAPFFQYRKYELRNRLTVIFLLTGFAFSTIGFLLTLIFQQPLWMNTFNLLCMFVCLILPIIMTDRLIQASVVALFFVSVIYFPFIYFTTAGNHGPAPIYFVMILVYLAFYLQGTKLFVSLFFLLIYYTIIMVVGYMHSELVVPYHDETSKIIELCMTVISVSVVMSIIASITFTSYNQERDHVIDLMNELKKKNRELEQLSIKDQLTGIYNRRRFNEVLKKELELLEQENNSLYILMIDIDHFKRINDTYGHLYGDEILKLVANGIGESVRSHDLLARYGGEEFIVLLSRTNESDAYQTAERIRKHIEKIEYRNERQITVSIGIARGIQSDSVLDVIKRADELLYSAKEKGRNRVELH